MLKISTVLDIISGHKRIKRWRLIECLIYAERSDTLCEMK